MTKAIDAVTGESVSTRGSKKIKGVIGLVDDTLGIKTADAVKGVIENGIVGTVIGGTKRKITGNNTVSKVLQTVDKVAEIKESIDNEETSVEDTEESNKKTDSSASEKKPTMSFDEQIEALKKLKGLLDAGILTQEEFEIKKKEVLGI